MEKKCFKCGRVRPLSDFYKHKQMADGHVNKCKACNKSDVRNNYKENKPHYQEYERCRAILPHRVKARKDYSKTDAGKDAGSRSKNNWNRRNPIKRMAACIVGNAVRDGKILKPNTCESCKSKPNRLHGHHDDYAFPLVVRWLCPSCHNKWHKENGEGLNAS